MNSSRTFSLLLIALLIFCFGLAAHLQPQFQAWENVREQSDDFFQLLLGDSSRVFANSAFVEADVYYHSGYYPTIFDSTKAFETPHIAEDTGAVASHNEGDETGFMGPPRDWIDAFGRHFIPNRHTHLDEGGPTDDLSTSGEVREILPWLKLSAELDPEDVRTYIVTAFWLRSRLHQPREAEQVLRGGLRYNPGNPQLLYELGRVYFENYQNPAQARNIWNAALRSWAKEMAGQPDSVKNDFDNRFLVEQIKTHLATLEEQQGNLDVAILIWQQVKAVSPEPASIQKHIEELQKKEATQLQVTPELP